MPRLSSPSNRVTRNGPGVPLDLGPLPAPRGDAARARVVRMDNEEEQLADQIGRELETAERLGREAGGR